MSASRRAAALGSLAAAVAVVASSTACGHNVPHPSTYTFSADDAAVKVDTPELRALKAAASIAPCPAATSQSTSSSSDVTPGLPHMTLPCLGGGRDVDLASLRGPLLLNFWSQTCGPCRKEAPLLEELSSSAASPVRVIGVDFYDPRPAYALEFARQYGLTYPQIADPEAATKADLRIAGLPTTFLIDSSGRIAYTQVGAVTSSAELAKLLREHLGVSVATGRGA